MQVQLRAHSLVRGGLLTRSGQLERCLQSLPEIYADLVLSGVGCCCSCLRGVSRYCPLLKRLWSSEEVTDIVSNIAGVKLKPVMEYELGVCNIQVGVAGLQHAVIGCLSCILGQVLRSSHRRQCRAGARCQG